MSFSIKKNFKHHPVQEQVELKAGFEALLVDLAMLRTNQIALLTKMDADFADVANASVDYVSTTSPDALTVVE